MAVIKHDDINSISYDLENDEIKINFKSNGFDTPKSIKFKVDNIEVIKDTYKEPNLDFYYDSEHNRAF